MEKHVFISYQHDDSDFADALIYRVEKVGFKTWIDNNGLYPGEDWREGIDQSIRDAFALIVIMSPVAKASEYVTYEWAFAWGCGIKVIPVMYKFTSLHPRLESLQYLDFTNRLRPWNDLMRTLQMSVSRSSPSSSLGLRKVQEWIDKGELFLDRKEYHEALEMFRTVILLDPSNVQAYIGKCTALYELNQYKEALVASEQAISLGASSAAVWSNKGAALNGLKRYEEALAACEQALRLDPGYVRAWNHKGAALRGLKRYEEALAACEQALRLDPGYVRVWNNKGVVFYDMKCYEEALSAYEEALRLNLNYALVWYNKGNTLKQLGRSEEAEQCYKKARDLGYEGYSGAQKD
jgi:tetratricopeptide (TPR) repeat protein